MCIICNCSDDGDEFLLAFLKAQRAMKEAKDAMLKCSKSSVDKTAAKQYDRVHKEMVRLIKEWNRLEEKREQHPDA